MAAPPPRLPPPLPPAIPLSATADAAVRHLARLTGSPRLAALDGAALLGERAALGGLRVPGRTSAGGGCALYAAADGCVALGLARPDDRALLPALLEAEPEAVGDAAGLSRAIGRHPAARLVGRGRSMGMAIADAAAPGDAPVRPGARIAQGKPSAPATNAMPRILDLTALWAGPLATHLMALAGAEVVKVESRKRPDAMRDGDAGFFRLLNQGKASVALDPTVPADRAALVRLIDTADIVVEASRPRALLQLGIDADRIVATRPGLVWISITGHGATGAAAAWVGFGDDTAVAGGLSAALRAASGRDGFVGDAIADPLTGIHAAIVGWEAWRAGAGGRYDVALSGVAAWCLHEARRDDRHGLDRDLQRWADAEGQGFAPVASRRIERDVAGLGADTDRILRALPSC